MFPGPALPCTVTSSCSVIAVDRRTGQLRWRTLVDPHVGSGEHRPQRGA
jgi:hypothetical protein